MSFFLNRGASGSVFLAELYHEIAPPVDYSLKSAWPLLVASFFALSLIGLIGWWLARKRKSKTPPKTPRERALEDLDQFRDEVEHLNPYQFSIQVSDILRRYVTEQYDLPVTRQTSVEFLERVARNSSFSGDDKMLLEDFLSRCDLIKFARYAATPADSRLLLDEAIRFAEGGTLATVS